MKTKQSIVIICISLFIFYHRWLYNTVLVRRCKTRCWK